MTRNPSNLPINFFTTGNFLNIKNIKFIPIDKSNKIISRKISKKNSLKNLSQTISNKDKSKDEIIKQLKERIIFLENKIKILEKENEMNKKKRKQSLSKTLILNMNNSFKSMHDKNKISIPLDKNLLKSKLSLRKKNIIQIFKKKNSFNLTELSMNKKNIHNNNNSISTINNSISNYYTNNNSSTGSALKPKKKSINLINKGNTLNSIHELLHRINSKITKRKGSASVDHRKNKSYGGIEKKSNPSGKKVNAIPKKGRKNYNASPKMMMSSTNYSNNISNSFKEDGNIKKISPKKNNNSSICEKGSLIEIKNKLENIQIRTKNLLGFYSSINFDKSRLNNNIINKEQRKCANYSHYIKISKIEKLKKD
jgi:hypothetical protein